MTIVWRHCLCFFRQHVRSLAFSLASPSWKIKRMLHFVLFFVEVNASKAVRLSCTLDSLYHCFRAASVFGQSRNRCVGKLRTAAVWSFLVRFTKTKHARLDQDTIFPTIYWVWRSTEKWRRSARSKLPAGIGTVIDRPVPERKLRSFLGFSASPQRPRKWPQVKSPLHLKV